MKLYTAKFDADHQDLSCTVTVPLDSSFGVAVGVKYQGEDVHIRKNEILLDGQNAIDVVDDKYAVFRLSSDGNVGTEGHEVKSVTDGMTVIENSFKYILTQEDMSANLILKCDTLNGLTISPPMSTTTGQSPAYKNRLPNGWPLLMLATNNGNNVYAGVPTYMYGVGTNGDIDYNKPVAYIAGSGRDTNFKYTLQVSDGVNWVNANEFTVPEDGMYLYFTTPSMAKYTTNMQIDYTYIEKISCDFGLRVQKKDLGEIGGYGDDLIFENTTNLSGTYADGTDFSYTVPVVVGG